MSEEQKAIEKLKEISFMTGYKQALDLAIKAIRIVEVVEDGFKRDGNLMDSDDWEDIKKFVEEVKNERPQTIGCFNCKHDYKNMTEEPCKYCNEKFSEWEAEGGRE